MLSKIFFQQQTHEIPIQTCPKHYFKMGKCHWLLVQLIKTFITVHLLKDLNFEMKFYEDVSRDERLDGT
jgi:hypothetical protein